MSSSSNNIGRRIFIRNTRTNDLLEIFFLSAVSSVLLVRFYLHIADYPKIAGGDFHIAHVLWGGILLMMGIVISLAFLGYRAQKVAAFVGGIGFGMFIDEIGKFITKDNNYFYEPAIGILYAIFVIIFIAFNYLDHSRNLTKKEYQINALYQIEEAIIKDMSNAERERILDLLHKSGSNDLTHNLRSIVKSLQIKKQDSRPNRLSKLIKKIDKTYSKFWLKNSQNSFIKALFISQIGLIIGLNILSTYRNINDIVSFFDISSPNTYGQDLIIFQFISSCISAVIVLYGIYRLAYSRLEAFELFKVSIIITLLLTQFFLFLRIEFAALPSFVFNILLYMITLYVIDKEKRLEEL